MFRAALRLLGRLLVPTPLAGCIALLAALGVAYVLLIGLDPEPRHRATVPGPTWHFGPRTFTSSQDGTALIFDRIWRGNGPEVLAPMCLLDVFTATQIQLQEPCHMPVFAPDGMRFVIYDRQTAYLRYRATGKELNRYDLSKLPLARTNEVELAFLPDVGLVAWCGRRKIGEESEDVLIALAPNGFSASND